MGIPKFYRWVSERYPCLSQVVREYQIPEFDNLYLDMNGIIHQCSHPDDGNPHFRITEEQIFNMIGHYVEVLFKIIKPRKYFFMAIDGVAPRAKMNQQRARRYRTAREAVDMERKARERGELLPDTPRFDSNCITPGTEFMARLHEFLQKFVAERISSDPAWHDVTVILSGHDVPGEGEHKVMDFIRSLKSSADYSPTTRHCLYGLDADLMMLGLTTHEPNFALLREEVRFGKQTKRVSVPEEQTFHLLHLSLMREYLDHEFSELKVFSGYDLESIIDDFVLICFLVGNDFIPHLPNLHIHDEGLTKLFRTYIEWQRSNKVNGYLNEKGSLHLVRFESFIRGLDAIEREHLTEEYADMRFLDSKRAGSSGYQLPENARRKPQADTGNRKQVQSNGAFGSLANRQNMDDPKALTAFFQDDEVSSGSELGGERETESGYALPGRRHGLEDEEPDEQNEEEAMEDLFDVHKRSYYREKFGSIEDAEVAAVRRKAREYVVAIQWILSYYYDGIQSWSWFYPFHYAPFISDLRGFAQEPITFNLAEPFLPYEQLMSVLPPASAKLLPPTYRELMLDAQSTIADFYPLDFRTDLNGKRQDWEAVVLIPFIDEKRLLEALKPLELTLSELERHHNRRGEQLVFSHSKQRGQLEGAPHTAVKTLPFDAYHVPLTELRKGLVIGSTENIRLMPNFPSLRYVPHRSQLRRERVRVFQQDSRGENMILFVNRGVGNLANSDAEYEEHARALLGTVVHVRWPHSVKALVTSVTLTRRPVRLDVPFLTSLNGGLPDRATRNNCRVTPLDDEQLRDRDRRIRDQIEHYLHRYGVNVGSEVAESKQDDERTANESPWARRVEYLLEVRPVMGYRCVVRSRTQLLIEPIWSEKIESYVFETCVTERALRRVIVPEHAEVVKTVRIHEHFPIGADACLLNEPFYGEQVRIREYDGDRIRVQLTHVYQATSVDAVLRGAINRDPDDLGVRALDRELNDSLRYMETVEVARRVGADVSAHFVARITGTVYVRMTDMPSSNSQQMNVGLGLRFTKRNQIVEGYTQMIPNSTRITFSSRVVDLLAEYRKRFPLVFEYVLHDTNRDDFTLDDLVRSWPNKLDPLAILRELNGQSDKKRRSKRKPQQDGPGPAVGDYSDASDDAQCDNDDAESLESRRRAAARVCIAELSRWLKSLPYNASPTEYVIPNGSRIMPPEIVARIETRAAEFCKRKREVLATMRPGNYELTVLPTELYRMTKDTTNLVPDRQVMYQLLDRVICVRSTSAVEFGSRGTIIGLIYSDKIDELTFEVLFDDEFRGGLRLRGAQTSRVYRFSGPCGLINLSHGYRKRCQALSSHGIQSRIVRSFDWQNLPVAAPIVTPATPSQPPLPYATVAAVSNKQPEQREKSALTGRGPTASSNKNSVATRMLLFHLPKNNLPTPARSTDDQPRSNAGRNQQEAAASNSVVASKQQETKPEPVAAGKLSAGTPSDFQTFLKLVAPNAAGATTMKPEPPETKANGKSDSRPTDNRAKQFGLEQMLRNAQSDYKQREAAQRDNMDADEPLPQRSKNKRKDRPQTTTETIVQSADLSKLHSDAHHTDAHAHTRVTNVALQSIRLEELFGKATTIASSTTEPKSLPEAIVKSRVDADSSNRETEPGRAEQTNAANVPKTQTTTAATASNTNTNAILNISSSTSKAGGNSSEKTVAVVAPITTQALFNSARRPPQVNPTRFQTPNMFPPHHPMPMGPNGPPLFPPGQNPQRVVTTNALALVHLAPFPGGFPTGPFQPPFVPPLPPAEQFCPPFAQQLYVGQPYVMPSNMPVYAPPNDNRPPPVFPPQQLSHFPMSAGQPPIASPRQAFMPLQVQRRQAHTNAQQRRQTAASGSSTGAPEIEQPVAPPAQSTPDPADSQLLSPQEGGSAWKDINARDSSNPEAAESESGIVQQLSSTVADISLNNTAMDETTKSQRAKKGKKSSRIAALLKPTSGEA